jgi:hypothetical protein
MTEQEKIAGGQKIMDRLMSKSSPKSGKQYTFDATTQLTEHLLMIVVEISLSKVEATVMKTPPSSLTEEEKIAGGKKIMDLLASIVGNDVTKATPPMADDEKAAAANQLLDLILSGPSNHTTTNSNASISPVFTNPEAQAMQEREMRKLEMRNMAKQAAKQNIPRAPRVQYVDGSRRAPPGHCYHCKRYGHKMSACYQLEAERRRAS